MLLHFALPCTDMTLAPLFGKAMLISGAKIRFRNRFFVVILCKFLLILDNFCMNRKLILEKVPLYKSPSTPFWPCPAKQQGIFLSFHLRGNTKRQMLCTKGDKKGDKNWQMHVRARYFLQQRRFCFHEHLISDFLIWRINLLLSRVACCNQIVKVGGLL